MHTKQIICISLVFVLTILCLNINAQVKTKVFYTDIPLKFKPLMKQISKIKKIEPPSEFYTRLNEKLNEEIQFAIPVEVNIDFLKEAIVEESENTLKYSFAFEVKDALNLSLQFSEFRLPVNAVLSIYTKNELTDSISTEQNNANNV